MCETVYFLLSCLWNYVVYKANHVEKLPIFAEIVTFVMFVWYVFMLHFSAFDQYRSIVLLQVRLHGAKVKKYLTMRLYK